MEIKSMASVMNIVKTESEQMSLCCTEMAGPSGLKGNLERAVPSGSVTKNDSNQGNKSVSDVKEETVKEEPDSEESGCSDSDWEDSNRSKIQYNTVLTKNYKIISVKEKPLAHFKNAFQESPLIYEKQRYHQQVIEKIVESNCIKLKDLQAEYQAHLRKAANINMYACSQCDYQTMNLSNLNCHLLIIHNSKLQCETFKCSKCDYESNYHRCITKHLTTHKNAKQKITYNKKPKKEETKERYSCLECTYQGRSLERLRKHSLTHKDKTKCDLCTFESQDKITLKAHKDSHKTGDKFQCYKCEYAITNKTTLGRHLLNIHKIANEASKRSKICEVCSHSFSNINQLQIHYLTHKDMSELSESEIHKCQQCDFQTKYKTNYRLHMLVHKAPEFICEICGFATKYKKNYRNHLITHKKISEIDWFQCSMCPYKCRTKAQLDYHMKKGIHGNKNLRHIRNRDRLREAEEKGEPLDVIVKKYRIKKIGGMEIKRENLKKLKQTRVGMRKRKIDDNSENSMTEQLPTFKLGGVLPQMLDGTENKLHIL